MTTRPEAAFDAKAHIAKIRRDKGLSEDNPSVHNVSDLESALTTLSEQLYQSSTHFLLELIQNADDNTYDPDVQPSVQFTYSNGCLRVDCNEVGFSPPNVEALCRVGQSTKKGGDNVTRYVGEKGIGFKSVFKAADVVWISSGDYSFKFDKKKQLGMIAPIWDEFPAPVKPGFTSLYLQLSEKYNRRGLLDELRSLDSRLLIFLRRLRNISVSISEPFRKIWKSSFSRAEVGEDLIRLVENNQAYDYIFRRHQVSNMPQEPKRKGISSSEIILGFPITEDNQPKRESQYAYAFLPIRDYGFEFLIQADFLLIASREDIDDSSEWNHAIRRELFTAFLNVIKGFNNGKLRYLWPRYLPTREPLQSFLKPFHLELREKLGLEPVFFSQSGDLAPPKSLSFVPEDFTFNGAPMTISAHTSRRYLSGRYLESDLEYLNVLGVVEMSDQNFFLELSSLVRNMIGEFKAKSDAWHSHLSDILIRFPQGYFSQLANLALIPLNDGSWVSANGRQILFPANKTETELPGGLEISVVDSRAAADPERRKLFKLLGVGDLEQEPVVRRIQDLHRNGRASTNLMTSTALISQIEFLYSAGWRNPTFQRFWFTSESGQRFHGSQLYQDSSKPHSATKFFTGQRNRFRFIHKDYMAAAGNDPDSWVRWLEEKMEVATMPRLIKSTVDRGFILSDDFEFIIKNFPTSDVLLLLRENWKEYSNFIDPVEAAKCSLREDMITKFDDKKFAAYASQLQQKLASMLVTCTNGKKYRLDATFIPSRELLVASQDDVPFVDIPNAEDMRWQVLKALGVSIKVDVSFYLRCLERLEGSEQGASAEKLYNRIQFRCDDEAEAVAVKNFCSSRKVVYIPAIGQRKNSEWVSPSRCRWKGPLIRTESQDLRTFTSLKDLYPGNKRLFCDILGVKDATLQDLVLEAKSIMVGDSLVYITSIFHAMERLLEDDPKSSKLGFQNLKFQNVFPVSKNWKFEVDKVLAIQNSTNKSEWFIADTTPFRTIFAGVIPLLDFKVDDLAAMDQVLEKLGLKSRFLSKKATSVPKIQGVVQLNKELTETIRSKVNFIVRLIPTLKNQRTKRREVIKQLRNVQVYTADEVIQEWSVQYKGKSVKGPPGNGHVALVAEGDALKIYLAEKSGFGINQTQVELVDEIFNFCGMQPHNPEHSEMCLHVALSQDDPVQTLKIFANKGIPSLESLRFADAEADADEDNSEDDEKKTMSKKKTADRVSDSIRTKTKFRSFSDLSLSGGFLGEIVDGLWGRRHFDNRNKGDGENINVQKNVSDPNAKNSEPFGSKSQSGNGSNQFSKSISKGWLRVQTACTFPSYEEVAFKGEFAVHKVLAETLGNDYNPLQHWTSKRRSKAKFATFSVDEDKQPTFKFLDVGGSFTQLLINDQFPGAKDWVTSPPTYHVDVKSTKGDIRAEFAISPAQFQRARDLSIMIQQMKGNINSIPNDVYIIARVYGVDVMAADENGEAKDTPQMVFLVDPWEYYHADRLLLKHKGPLVGSIV